MDQTVNLFQTIIPLFRRMRLKTLVHAVIMITFPIHLLNENWFVLPAIFKILFKNVCLIGQPTVLATIVFLVPSIFFFQ